MKCGEIIVATVKSFEDYGMYLTYKEKIIFVTIVNITWLAGLPDKKKYQSGTKHQVKIIKAFKEPYKGVHYLGSIKDAYPEENPWKDEKIYAIGAKFSGSVMSIAEYGIIIELSTGALGLMKYAKEKLPIKSSVTVEVVDVDIDTKRILLKLVK